MNQQPIEKLQQIAQELNDKENNVLHLTNNLILDEEFQLCSGSGVAKKHHYGDHGLITHTCEVVESCLAMAKYYEQYNVDKVELFLSALYHDAGKVKDYKIHDTLWGYTEHHHKIHHLAKSAIIWSKAVNELTTKDFRIEYEDKVTHAILSHHGLREWRSPVQPQSRVAWLLHLCDSLSARLNETEG